ncbi:Pentatricopeptide repeat [Dillenia turbinata]|uniref:Pentatricopeptide repeat n=1 Tax=Dillenia turbinata TaxID=194707 RepID=A0AAN8Z6H8_9MAGN
MGPLAVVAVKEWRDMRFLSLDDGRKLCLECLDSAIMDTHECQPLYLEIQEFYEGLNMKVEQQIPLLLVERQALNEAMGGEKGHHHLPETRGLCLSEEQIVSTILRRPRIGAGYRIIDMITEPYRLIRRCEVTAILILYGLPRLLTGSILAHEMMHAWLRLKGYPNLSQDAEEGICQVLAHMWLVSEIIAGSGSDVASTTSSSSSSSSSESASSKKGKRSEFERKLGEFFKHQIESDSSPAYGDGFKAGNQAVLKTKPSIFLTHQQCCLFSSRSIPNKVTLYLRRAKLIDSLRLCLRSGSGTSLSSLLNDPNLDSFIVTHALRSASSPDSALSLIDALKRVPHFSHTQVTIHTVAKILAKAQRPEELGILIDAVNSGKFINVARVSFMDRMRWFALAGDLESVLHVWDEWRGLMSKRPCTESYNIVMDLYAKMGMDFEAVNVFNMLVNEGANPNARTYTVMIKHLVNVGKLDQAFEIFKSLPSMRMKRTVKQYSILVGGFISIEQFDVVKSLLNEMHIDGMLPTRSMRLSLECMREKGYVEETNEFLREMLPDERIQSIGVVNDSSDDEEDENENHLHGNDCCEDVDVDGVKLKPWLDPSALANSLNDWRSEEVLALENAKFVWTTRLVCKMIRNFKSAVTAWEFFCWVAYQPGGFVHDVYTVSRMITKLARQGNADLVGQLICKIKREGIILPVSSLRLILDFYGISKNTDAALRVFHDVKDLCGRISKFNMMLLYTSLLRTLAKCRRSTDVLNILEEMMLCGIIPDIQTFSGLMHHFALEGDLRTVQNLFGMVRQSGVGPDAYMYKVLIQAYCKCDRAALALRVFEDMMNANLLPDAATKALLVKSLWKEEKLREAAAVEERTEQVNEILPFALPGHVYTVSAVDLKRVYDTYISSFENGFSSKC